MIIKHIVNTNRTIAYGGVFTLLIAFLFPLASFSQAYTTQSAGEWNNPTIWLVGGSPTATPPTNANSTSITVSHAVTISVGAPVVSIDQTTITATGSVTVNSGFTLRVNNGGGTDLSVLGKLDINGGTFTNFGSAANAITFNNANLVNNGTVNLTSGTLTLSGTTSLTGTPTATTFFATTINAGAVISVPFGFTTNGLLTVNGSLTTNAALQAAAVTVTGGGSLFTANANYSTSGTFTVNTTFSAGASANGTITGNLAGTGTFTSTSLVTFGGVTTVTGAGIKTFNDVTVTGSISASTNVSIVVNGDLNNNGTINFSNGTWSLAGTSKLLNGSPTLTSFFALNVPQNASRTSSIQFTTTSTFTIGGTFVNNATFTAASLTISGAAPIGVLTANSTFDVVGAMTVSGSATALAGFNAMGALTVTGTSGSLTSSNDPFSTTGLLTVSAGGTLLASGGFDAQAITVTGAGSTFTTNTTEFTVSGTLTVNTSGLFTANSDGFLSGNLTGNNSNAIYTSTALTTFDGASVISGAGTRTLNNVVVTGSTSGTGSVTINGDLTNNGGSINQTGGTWTLAGTAKLLNGTSPTLTSFFALTVPATATRTTSIPFTTTSTFTVGGTVVSNASFTAAALTVSAGTPVGSLTTNASFSVTGATTVNGSLVSNNGFTASGAFTVAASTGTFTGNTNPFSIGGILTVNGIFTANAGANMTLTSGAGNNFVVAVTTGNFNSLATVIFNGVTSMTGTGTRVFNNIQVNSGRTLNNTAIDFTVTGNINNNGGTINLTGGILTIDGATQLGGSPAPVLTSLNAVTINNTRSLTISTNITIIANLIINGSITGNDGTTVTFLGLTMSGSGAGTKTFDNIVVGAGTFTPSIDYSITGDIQVTGTMASGSATTSLTGSTTITGNASFNNLVITGTLVGASGTTTILHNFTNNGTCNLTSGTVLFSTTSIVQQIIAGTQDITFNNLTLSNVGTAVDLINEIDAARVLSLRGALSFSENNSVFDSDGAANNKTLILLSTNDTPVSDASIGIIGTGSGLGTNNVTVQRYMSTEGGSNSPTFDNGRIYRYLSTPVNNPPVSQLQDDFYVTGAFAGADGPSTPGCTGCTTGSSLFFYNPTAIPPAYVAFPGGNLTRGVGYAAFIRNDLTPPLGGSPNSPIVVDFTGSINSGAIPGPTVVSDVAVWSLVGNPYASPIAWNNAGTGSSNIAAGIVIRDNDSGVPGGTFQALGVGGKIAAGQAFWVRAAATGPVTALTFNEADKTSITGTTFFKTSEEISNQFSLKVVRQDGIADETVIRQNTNANQALDTYDIPKKNGSTDLNNDYIDITSVSSDGKSLLLNNLPQINCGQQIQLNFEDQLENGTTDLTSATFSISINTSGAMKALTWILHDVYTNNHNINLSTTPNYSFTISNSIPGSYAKQRFYLTTESSAINVSNSIESSSSVCAESETSISIMNSQVNMTYGLDINGNYYPNLAKGTGGEISIDVDSELFTSATNTVKVKVNSGCAEEFLTASLTINKEELPQIQLVTGASSCKIESLELNASGAPAGSTYKWYKNQVGGLPLAVGEQFNTPVLSDSTTYYVSAVSSGCEGPRLPVLAAISNLSANMTLSKSSEVVCKGGAMILSASSQVPNASFNWYASESSSTSLFTGDEYTTSPLNESATYYVSLVNQAGCESGRVAVHAEVSSFTPAIHAVSVNETICSGGWHTLVASGAPAGATYQWFETMDAVQPISESTSFETAQLLNTRSYYVQSVNEVGCTSARVAIEAKVNTSDPSLGIEQSIEKACQGQDKTFVPHGAPVGSSYRWYLNSTDVTPVAIGNSATWENLHYKPTYYISAVNTSGCEGSRKEISLDVISFIDAKIDSAADGMLVSNYSDGNQWFFNGDLLQGEVGDKIVADRSGVYSLKVLVQGVCESWSNQQVVTVVTGSEEPPFSDSDLSVYPNPLISNILNVKTTTDFDPIVSLMDSYGREVYRVVLSEFSGGKQASIETQNLPKGFYYLRAKRHNKQVFLKVIKQ